MKKYKPNFNDPRVKAKAYAALAWATQQLSEDKPNGWSKHHLDKRIGYSHNNLGAWLRQQLLNTHNTHYNMLTAQTKQYTLRTRGAAHIAQLLGIEYTPRKIRRSIGLRTAIEQHAPVFNSPCFEYTEKNCRSYHPLQNIRTDIREPLFAHYGFRYNYDIENAYPTLVLQFAQQSARFRKPLDTLCAYVDNPTHYRQQLAQALNVDVATAKKIIVARFNGATLRNTGAIREQLTPIQFYKLKNNLWFEQLNQDIRRAWSGIARYHSKNSLSNRSKMEIYLKLEQQVIGIIQREFSKRNIHMFLEHDGWRANDYIDPYLLKLRVKKSSGFTVNFTCSIR